MNVDVTDDHDKDVTHQMTLRTMTTIGLTNVVTKIIANGKINEDRTHKLTHNPTNKCHLRHHHIHSNKANNTRITQDIANNHRTTSLQRYSTIKGYQVTNPHGLNKKLTPSLQHYTFHLRN